MTRHWTAFTLALALGPLVSLMHPSPAVRAQGSQASQSSQAQGATGDACSALATLAMPHVTISSATPVAAGAFTPPTPGNAAATARFSRLPAFCRVQATLTPTDDSSIGMEVWLPSTGWNGRFQGVGGRALAGIIVYPAMASALADGYATASTDTGHVGAGGGFAAGHPEKVVDHGHRAVHEMTIAAKQVIDKFYGRAAQKHYWNGCSLGGRQGLAEAQRYPQDYDGIITGDIANDITGLYAARLQQHQWAHRSPEAALTPEALRALNTAVVNACDRLDGVADGILENPQQCHVDPGTIQCGKPGAPAECLNAGQVETARRMYAPVRRPDKSVVSNGLMPGSEAGWTAVLGAEPERNSVEVYRHMVFKDPQWDWKTFQLMPALTAAKTSSLKEVDAVDPNLAAFFAHGGKLLMYHGYADPQTPTMNGLDYYTRVGRAVGRASYESIRMFLGPGVGHCEGGAGADTFDMMEPLVAWVERGAAPARVEASKVMDGKTVRTHPMCPYPEVAKYNGSGDPKVASSFSCGAP